MTVIVRLDRDETAAVTGVVERVRTGEKVRVRSLEEVAAVLARMLAAESEAVPTSADARAGARANPQ